MTTNYTLGLLGAICFTILLACKTAPDYGPIPDYNTPAISYSFDNQPVWQDEFDKNGLPDATKWGYDVGGSGWGNNELQYYTKSTLKNARIENGKLIIEAHKEDFEGKKYTSARLITKQKADWQYGKFVIRAKLPQGVGTWPAIWMLATSQSYGTSYWPDNGEIDIMEHVGFDPNVVHGTIHTKSYYHGIGTQRGAQVTIPDAMTTFHDYSLEWSPADIKIGVDGSNYFTFAKESDEWQKWPFNKPFYLLLNIAIGGSWGGQKGVDDSIFPQRMEIDYVRVYTLKTK